MLWSQNAKFAFNLLKNWWYKKGVNMQKLNALDNSVSFMINIGSKGSVPFMCGIYNNKNDDLINNSEVE